MFSKLLTFSLYFLSLLYFPLFSYSQDTKEIKDTQIDSAWVSVSNDFIKISMDKKTGRYIVYDQMNYHPVANITPTPLPSFLTPTSPIPMVNKELSPLLGNSNALNMATLNIDNYPVIFGSSVGQWVSAPIVSSTNIVYAWRIGGVDVIQTLAIITNSETQFPDAVAISYDIRNTSSSNIRSAGARLVLDPTVGDGKETPFYLPDTSPIRTEYQATLGAIPTYWITADQKNTISPLSIKGLLTGDNTIPTSRVYFTTMKKTLLDIWDYQYLRRGRINERDNAVILYFDDKEIFPNTTQRVASAVVTIPSLLTVYQNNGLEVRANSFISKNTVPLSVDLWISNTRPDVFDTIEAHLNIPNSLELYDEQTKVISDMGSLNLTSSASWSLGTRGDSLGTYTINAQIRGLENGIMIAQLNIPITLFISPNIEKKNKEIFQETVQEAISNITKAPVLPTIEPTKTIVLEPFLEGDTLGSDSEQLAKIYRSLQTSNAEDNRYILQMIETEQQLLKEIQEAEKALQQVNKQYQILTEVYNRTYVDSSLTDQEHINIQGLVDNIQELEYSLRQKETAFSSLTN